MKGIVLAGGTGSRLYPTTSSISKQLIPVYDKPAIYYPLSTLMFMDIKEIAIISSAHDLPMIKELLGDGQQLGLKLTYLVQKSPKGIADAFNVGKDFLANEDCCLILGDNLFFGHDLPKRLRHEKEANQGATIFAIQVKSPENFGVIEVNKDFEVLNISEKPEKPVSNWAVTGLYFFDGEAFDHVQKQKPSARGELEVTDLIDVYLKSNKLRAVPLGRGTAWLDTGTPENLLKSAQFVQTIEERQGFKIACLEEIALRRGFIDISHFEKLTANAPKCSYADYLLQVQSEFKDSSMKF